MNRARKVPLGGHPSGELPAPRRLLAGDVILGRYEIDCELGAGGMGVVYRARQTALGGRHVAIKHINAAAFSPQEVHAAIEHLRREGLTLASLHHPNLVQIYDCVEEQGDVYLVMEYVDGDTLEMHVARSERLSFDALVGFANQLSDVLSYLHRADPPVLFRDLKPSNVMLDRHGKLRLIDFGVARSFGDAATVEREEGTPGFASPEQLRVISVPPDMRSDVYSLGATLYFLATGQIPTDARKRVLEEQLVPVTRLRHDLPIRLQAVFKKALRLNPDERYQSVEEFQDALLNLQFEVNNRDTKRLLPYPTLAPAEGEEAAAAVPPMPALTSTAIIRSEDVAARRGLPRMKTLIISAAHTLAAFGGRKAQPVLGSADCVTAYVQDWKGRHEPLTLCGYRDELLCFVNPRRDTLRFPLKIRFFLPGATQALERVFVQAFRTPDTSPQQYTVPMAEMPYDLRQALQTMFSPQAAHRDRRQRRRLQARFQVTSSDLWGNRAVGLDVNATGACVHAPLSVETGLVLPVTLHLDDEHPQPVDVQAEVRWCETQMRGGSYLGLQFIEPSPEVLESLRQYERQAQVPLRGY